MILKTKKEIVLMAEAGRRLAFVLERLASEIKPGLATKNLDTLALELIASQGAKPAFLGYRPSGARAPFPAAICVSINEVLVHGLPSAYALKEGDVVKIDAGLAYKGFCADAAVTVGAGEIAPAARKLIAATREALHAGIKEARPGNTLGDIGAAIEKVVRGGGFSVAALLTGHGIGRKLHEEPSVLNRGKPGEGMPLKAGMVLAIEPMVVAGRGEVRQLPDDSFAAQDGTLTAHFEHTVAITEQGPRVLTQIS